LNELFSIAKTAMKLHLFRTFSRRVLMLAALGLGAFCGSRGFAKAPPGHYVIGSADQTGTVLDTKTGLTWMRAPIDNPLDWVSANTYCTDLTFGGSSDWRLPTIKELATLIDDSRMGPAVDPDAFPAMPSASFWSATLMPYSSTIAHIVETNYGMNGRAELTINNGADKVVARAICIH
jgi:hypothetical protein